MRKTFLIPGAGRTAEAMWPLQVKDDATLVPVNFKRGFIDDDHEAHEPNLLSRYALRIFEQIAFFDEEIDIVAWSMGLPITTRVTALLDQLRPGQLKNVVGVNPGVFGGKLPLQYHNFHLNPMYISNLIIGAKLHKGTQTNKALKKIKKEIPRFRYQTEENVYAMLDAGSGIMSFPPTFDPARLHIWYSAKDKVIPPTITEFVAARAKITPRKVLGFDHDLPLQDTEGSVLKAIRKTLN